MSFNITLGWWLIPLVLTVAAWFPVVRHKGRGTDVAGALLLLASLASTMFVWLVYFAIGWALS